MDYKPGMSPPASVPAPVSSSGDSALCPYTRVSQQGELVRKLKAEQAPKVTGHNVFNWTVEPPTKEHHMLPLVEFSSCSHFKTWKFFFFLLIEKMVIKLHKLYHFLPVQFGRFRCIYTRCPSNPSVVLVSTIVVFILFLICPSSSSSHCHLSHLWPLMYHVVSLTAVSASSLTWLSHVVVPSQANVLMVPGPDRRGGQAAPGAQGRV